MSGRVASLPMYDLPELREAHDALWAAIARALSARGIEDVPVELDRSASVEELWSDPRLLVSQTCGYPLVSAFAGRLRVVATPRYRAPRCDGASYASAIVVGESASAERLEDLRGSVCAINDRGSHSGANVLRAMIAPLSRRAPFFRDVVVTGSHVASLEAVGSGAAAVCAIDIVTYTLLERHRPRALDGTRVLAMTPSAPAPPYVTRASASDELVATLRDAVRAAMHDAAAAHARAMLLLDGVAVLEPDAYDAISAVERAAVAHGYPELT